MPRKTTTTFSLANKGAIQAWYESAAPSSRGRPQRYSDIAITTVLVIKRVFRLTLRAAQGFIDSLFALMNAPLRCPDYTVSVSEQRRLMSVSKHPLGVKSHTWCKSCRHPDLVGYVRTEVAVHPRGRGEHGQLLRAVLVYARFIPADAGNTRRLSW